MKETSRGIEEHHVISLSLFLARVRNSEASSSIRLLRKTEREREILSRDSYVLYKVYFMDT